MKRLAQAAWTMLAVLLYAVSATATIIGVPSDQPTIQAGINAATDGDTVLVASGAYTENLDFIGRAVRVIGDGGYAATSLTPLAPTQSTVLMISGEGPGTQISGFTFVGGAGASVIEIKNGATPVIRDNVFRDFASYVQNAVCIRCYDSAPLITYNLFYNNVSIGCVGIFTGTADIINNTLDGNTRGFWSLNGNGIAKNNLVTNSTEFGIARTFLVQDYNCVWGNNPDYAEGAYQGLYSISADPLYCKFPTWDYTLASISPCLGSGEGGLDMGAFGEGCGEPEPVAPEVLAITVDTTADLLHVVDHTPIIAWQYFDAQSRSQTAAEVEVGFDKDWTVAELWDPPEFTGSDTSVVYAGLPLEADTLYWLRIRVSNGALWSNWKRVNFQVNSPPSPPVPYAPIAQTVIPGICTDLTVTNSTDADGDPLEYQFEMYSDAGLTVLVASDSGVSEGSTRTKSRVFAGLDLSSEYWWRGRAADGYEMSDWSSAESFLTGTGNRVIRVPDDEPTIQAGIDAALCDGDTVLVAPGTYDENIDFSGRSIHVISEGGADVTTLRPVSGSEPTVSIGLGEGPGTELNGFTLEGGVASTVIFVNSAEPLIQSNVFHGYQSYLPNAVVIGCHGSDPLIAHNLFYNNVSIGCVGIFSGTAQIINNTFDSNTRGFWTLSGAGIAKNNIVTNSVEYGIAKPFPEMDYNCVWGNHPDYDLGAVPGPHSLSANPIYCFPADRDYTLANISPCLGTGEGGVDIGARGQGCDAADLNTVRVASKTVPAGATGVEIPVFIDNVYMLSALDIPLIVREVTPGSYITSMILSYGDRLPEDGPLSDAVVKRTYPHQDGTCGINGFGTIGLPDYISPDAALFQRARIFSDPLEPGYDATGSLVLSISVTNVPGMFEIDTTCIDPSHHLLYIEDGTGIAYAPKFTKGTVTIDVPEPPGPNHVLVESKVVNMGSSSTVGIYLANDVALRGFSIPLAIRSVTPGVYPQTLTASYSAGTRLDGYLTEVETLDEYDTEDGTCKSGAPGGFGSPGVVGLTSPDAYKFTRLRISGPDWPPGDDSGIPSMTIAFNAPAAAGFFEIDTTCVDPSGHLAFINTDGQTLDGVTFAKGVIGVSPCACPNQSDFDEDGFNSALDLAALIDILFASNPDLQDASCPSPRGDFDCDGFSTALDLSGLIDYLFAGGAEPCDPCAM